MIFLKDLGEETSLHWILIAEVERLPGHIWECLFWARLKCNAGIFY